MDGNTTGRAGRRLQAFAVLVALAAIAALAPGAGAIVGGTTQVSAASASPVAFIEMRTPTGVYACSGTLISPTVVLTAAHCVYEKRKDGNLLGIVRPSDVSVRIGSTNVRDPALGTSAGVVAVLPQPRYRWDGSRHFHDVALLALDRPMPETPAVLAEQAPTAGEALLIAGYGQISTTDSTGPSVLREALIDAADLPRASSSPSTSIRRGSSAVQRRPIPAARRNGLLRRFRRAGVRAGEHGLERRGGRRHELRLA